MAAITIVTENVAPRLRGYLGTWLVELRAGVYVGNLSRRKREELWKTIQDTVEHGNCVMTWATNNESGYDFLMTGENRRQAVDFDGLRLVGFAPKRS